MKKLNEMTETKLPVKAAQYRYRFTPPESLTVKAADLEPAIPQGQRLKPFEPNQTVDLPAAAIFPGNIPKISLRILSSLLPNYIAASDAVIVLPAARLATAYAVIEQADCISEAEGQEPEQPVQPEPVEPVEPVEPAEPARGEPSLPPQKGLGLFSGLPMFRRKQSNGVEGLPLAGGDSADLPAPQNSDPSSGPTSPPEGSTIDVPVPPAPKPAKIEGIVDAPDQGAIPVDAPKKNRLPSPAPVLEAKARPPFSSPELADQEPLQSLFLTEETLTIDRVIVLCSELPGINSCVLTLGSMAVASHNVPENVDLVSMSSYAEEMLQAVRKTSARMGVGSVTAVTLHSEKGVISLFQGEELTLLVFHKDRGFTPGVREKLATVLGELAKNSKAIAPSRRIA